MKKIFAVTMLMTICLASYAQEFVIESFHAPVQYINKAKGDEFTFTEPCVFVEVCSGEKILERTTGQSIGGNKSDFYFSKQVTVSDQNFPIVVKIMIGEEKNLERGMRAAAGGGVCATIGGIAGGCLAGFVSGGLGAPAGAIIGAAIGGAIGGTGSLLYTGQDAREIVSFYFENPQNVKGEHKKNCENDILSDGQETCLIIK